MSRGNPCCGGMFCVLTVVVLPELSVSKCMKLVHIHTHTRMQGCNWKWMSVNCISVDWFFVLSCGFAMYYLQGKLGKECAKSLCYFLQLYVSQISSQKKKKKFKNIKKIVFSLSIVAICRYKYNFLSVGNMTMGSYSFSLIISKKKILKK